MQVSDREVELREAFRVFEEDGYISTDVLREIVTTVSAHLTEIEVDEIVQVVDHSGDGRIGFDRFASLMMLKTRDHADPTPGSSKHGDS